MLRTLHVLQPHSTQVLPPFSLLATRSRQHYTTAPRPPPPPPPRGPNPATHSQPEIITFKDTSKPRPYPYPYRQTRELPRIKSRWPTFLAFSLFGLGGWSLFLLYTTNSSNLNSSVVKGVLSTLRMDDNVRAVLGSAIRPEPTWYLNGDALIHGSISTMRGDIDISFRIRGTKGNGTVYFTSVRKEKGVEFTILRFRVVTDEGEVVDIGPAAAATSPE